MHSRRFVGPHAPLQIPDIFRVILLDPVAHALLLPQRSPVLIDILIFRLFPPPLFLLFFFLDPFVFLLVVVTSLDIHEIVPDLAGDDRLVDVLLLLRKRCVEEVLLLRRQVLFDIDLEPAEQEWLEDGVERGHDGRLVEQAGLFGPGPHLVKVEPLLERVEIVENVGKDEVEQGPQFGEVVLRRELQTQPRALRDKC